MKTKYTEDDIADFYFIIFDDGSSKRIQAWTDRKEMAKAYMEFHNSKNFHLKVVTDRVKEITKITEENRHDELEIQWITVRNTGKRKKGEEVKRIAVPLTLTESTFLREEENTFMFSRVNYAYFQGAYAYFKPKYQKLFKNIFLEDIMNSVLLNKTAPKLLDFQFNELGILLRNFPDQYG